MLSYHLASLDSFDTKTNNTQWMLKCFFINVNIWYGRYSLADQTSLETMQKDYFNISFSFFMISFMMVTLNECQALNNFERII